jgi:hypothetical protein
VDSERAERHLRLMAEAELRRALPFPGSGIPALPAVHQAMLPLSPQAGPGPAPPMWAARRPSAIPGITEGVTRVERAAGALTAVGAISADLAAAVLADLELALAVRSRTDSQAFGPQLMRLARRKLWIADPGPGEPRERPGTLRVIPVGRMLSLDVGGSPADLYLLSLVLAPGRAALTMTMHMRWLRGDIAAQLLAASGADPRYLPMLSATDAHGARYHVGFSGGGGPDVWEGCLHIDPAPPPEAQWLELAAGDAPPLIRLGLAAPPAPAEMAAETVTAAPGERLLDAVAERILAAAADNPRLACQMAPGLGSAVAALEAAGALPALSQVPGHLAGLCQRLGIGSHEIPAPAATVLPEPWTSVLACYGRRNRPAPRNGTAALAAVLPEVDGTRFALTGLRSGKEETVLHVMASGLPEPRRDMPLRAGWDIGYSWWVRDNTGHWHLAVTMGFSRRGGNGGETALRLRLLPPLARDVTSLDVVVTGPSARARAHVPLDWWAAP